MEQKKRLMLIVDDAYINRVMLKRQFENEFTVIEAADGSAGLEAMRIYAGSLNVVLLDMYMPKMSGFEVLSAIRADETLRGIPIIAVTGDENSEEEVLKDGAWDFVHKSSAPSIMHVRVENAVSRGLYAKISADKAEIEGKAQILNFLDDMPTAFVVLHSINDGEDLLVDYSNRLFNELASGIITLPPNGTLAGVKTSDYSAPSRMTKYISIVSELVRTQNTNASKYCETERGNESYAIYFYVPKAGYCACLVRDIAEIRQLRKEKFDSLMRENSLLQEKNLQNERYEIITARTGAVVFEFDREKKLKYVSNNLSAYNFKESIFDENGMHFNLSIIYPPDEKRFKAELYNRLISGDESAETIIRVMTNDNGFIWCKVSCNCTLSENGQVSRVIGTLQDVSNEQEYLERLRRDAEYDSITGIFNKQKFYSSAKKIMNGSEAAYCIIRFDIDNFKVINELFTHDEGDRLLVHISERLRIVMADCGKSSFGRLESDVFAVCTEKAYADYAAEKIITLAESFDINIDISISVGIYEVIDKSLSADVMCDRAHLAAKTVKGSAIRHIARFDEKMHDKIIREQSITSIMRAALDEKQFIVYYQPKYHLLDGTIAGAEALVRWINPTRGMIYPNEFIPVFERNGFIMKLDEYVWEQVCIYIRDNLDEGRRVLPISVNISKVNLYNPRICEIIIGLVEKYHIPVSIFQLELTESAFTDNTTLMDKVMKQFKDYGFTVMMDDFGSGYSSLNMLKDIPVDVLKIDLRFLSGDDDSGKGGKILSSIITMAKWLDMHVITEGIETRKQMDFLRSIGCEDGQGYFFAKPMPLQDYRILVENNSTIK